MIPFFLKYKYNTLLLYKFKNNKINTYMKLFLPYTLYENTIKINYINNEIKPKSHPFFYIV